MEIIEIFDEIEEIIKQESKGADTDTPASNIKEEGSDEQKSDNDSKKNGIKDIFLLIFKLLLNIVRAPFKLVYHFFKEEVVAAIKRDMKLFVLIMGLFVVLFVFFSVLWLFVSFAFGVYFYESGTSMFLSVVYSIVFQVFSLFFVGIIAYISIKKLRTYRLYRKLKRSVSKK